MDRGAWPFFVDGVTCLVISVSVCEEKREERREKMKRRWKGEWKRKWREEKRRKRWFFFKEKCFKTLKPARWISPKCFEKKKSLSDELFLHFSAKVQNLTVFFNYLHDSNSIFWARGINSEWVSGGTVSASGDDALDLRVLGQVARRPQRVCWRLDTRHLTRFFSAVSRSRQPAPSWKSAFQKTLIFLMQNRKRVSLTRTSGIKETVFPTNIPSCFLLLRSCVFDFSDLGFLFLRSCVLRFSLPPLPLFFLRFRNSFWSIFPRFVQRNMSRK